MSPKTLLFTYAALMLALALIVRCEFVRRRRGLGPKPGSLDQVDSPRINYSPPPDRSNRSLQRK
jgi:hypothetical protein